MSAQCRPKLLFVTDAAQHSHVAVRRAAEDDGEFLYELHRQAFGEVVGAIWGPWDDTRQREFHDAWFDPSRLRIVVSDGTPVGVIDAYERDPGTVYLARIELLPEFQGKRTRNSSGHPAGRMRDAPRSDRRRA